MHIFICMRIYMCVYVYIYIYIYVYVYIHTCRLARDGEHQRAPHGDLRHLRARGGRVRAYMNYLCIHVICMYVCMYVCMYIYIYIYIYTRTES